MARYEAIQKIMESIEEELVICNIGFPSRELYEIDDRPKNFYMIGSMGLASSIGFGLAMAKPHRRGRFPSYEYGFTGYNICKQPFKPDMDCH